MKYSLFFVLCLVAISASAQSIWENPKNLKVLPEDTSPAVLRQAMREFSQALGTGCGSCHVLERGKAFFENDFSSDDRPLKKSARIMMRMVQAINDNHISDLEAPGTTVSCMTCHRGLTDPRLSVEIFAESYRDGGIDQLKKDYAELRTEYYGTHSYDFSSGMLEQVAEGLAGDADADADQIEAVLRFNLEHNPDAVNSYLFMGNTHAGAGNTDKAIAAFESALEVDPDNRFAKAQIQQLKQQ